MANPHPVTKGRKRGVPNKFSIGRVERAIAEGRKQPVEELLRNAEECRAMAARFAPMRVNPDTGATMRSATAIGWRKSVQL